MQRLIEAAMGGSVRETELLLAGGTDVDVAGSDGDTALHHAIRNQHPRVAAALLSHGADWQLKNDNGKTPLSLDFTGLSTLHRVRQEYQRYPVAPYDGVAGAEKVAGYVDQLAREGVLRVSGLVNPEQLGRMKADFERVLKKLAWKRILPRKRFTHYDTEEYWHPAHRSYVMNDALRFSPDLLSLCCHPVVIETANRYLRKPGHIKRVLGMRYLPRHRMHTQQFGWHHDMEDRQLKLLVLLTDMGEEDQYMSYVRGTHAAFHPYAMFLKNAIELDYCRTYVDEIDVVNTTGRAGDVYFFDSNGMHRGNRSRGRVRDAYFVEFTADRNRNNLWGTKVERDRVPPEARLPDHPLAPMLLTTPKWERVRNEKPRRLPSWANSLEDPSMWI